RDRNVTGVQTCALPICTLTSRELTHDITADRLPAKTSVHGPPPYSPPTCATSTRKQTTPDSTQQRVSPLPRTPALGLPGAVTARSEERRVGKEGMHRSA